MIEGVNNKVKAGIHWNGRGKHYMTIWPSRIRARRSKILHENACSLTKCGAEKY